MRAQWNTIAILLTLVTGLLAGAGRVAGQQQPSAEVLLPYFEVETRADGATTMFAVANALDQPVDIVVTVFSNWGIQVSRTNLTLAAREVRTVNMRSWISGQVPGRSMTTADVAHLKATLSGRQSPRDHLYYSSPVAGRFTGYVRIATQGLSHTAALWGDYFFLDSARHVTYAFDLVNLDTLASCPGLCKRHALRFLAGAPFDSGTQVVVWTGKAGRPAASANPGAAVSQSGALIYDESGAARDGSEKQLLPAQTLTLADLGVRQPFGWVDLQTEEDAFVAVQYGATGGLSLGVQAWCLPQQTPPPGNGIRIHKLTNGADANDAPGPSILVGDAVHWQYIVENTGNVTLTDIHVTDDRGEQVTCPGTTLAAGGSMTCTANGIATACQYTNIGTVIAHRPDLSEVRDDDPSHYFGDQRPAIGIEKRTNSQRATTAPGPTIAVGSPVTWTYLVTNSGEVNLTDVHVADDRGVAVSCPRTSLHPGESMTCSGNGTATAGQYENVGSVTAASPCGVQVSAHDSSHYYGGPPPPPPTNSIRLKKSTNGEDADAAPGPQINVGAPVLWQYFVTNTGQTTLTSVHVSDNRGVAVSCPKTTLVPGEAMTCTGNGTASAGQYENVGSVTANPPSGPAVTSSDPSHYFGVTPQTSCIRLKKSTNGEDADAAPGPQINVGAPVLWQYFVTNTGQTTLTSVHVTDNRGVAVSCPKTTLVAGEAMTCAGNGTATAGQYENVGSVTANPPSGPAVTSSDPSHYFGVTPQTSCIRLKKSTNGEDADAAPGPQINVGAPVLWQYFVTNTGQTTLTNVHVTDNRGVAVSCPKTTLVAGEAMTCTGNGTATAGQYENVGSVTANPPSGPIVTSSDPSHYLGVTPQTSCIRLKKSTNGEDADAAPGPQINVGAPVLWQYFVTNTGQTTLTSVHVTDNRGVAVSCPKTTLVAGESMTCTGNGTASAGQYENVGSVTANPPSGPAVTSSDPSHYFGVTPQTSCIRLKKSTNGEDADAAPGPQINVGAPVLWQYFVTNTGQTTLTSVHVTDNRGVAVSCPKTTLVAGEAMTCTGNGTATAGQYENIGSVTANPPSGPAVTSSDPSHYFGYTPPPPPPGNQGCTPGYWKNHTSSWGPTGYQTSQSVQSVFSGSSGYPSLRSATLLEALAFHGGSDLDGAGGNLLRAATASLLNAAHPGVGFPRTVTAIVQSVNSALNSRNRDTILDLASDLDDDNNLGCPLN